MQRAARGLRRILPPCELIATSPYARAVQTAEILAQELGAPDPSPRAWLQPGLSREALLEWLRGLASDAGVAIVGHEPDLGETIAWLASGDSSHPVALKKGGACLLDLSEPIAPGGAAILWVVPPSFLRKLAR